MKQLDERLTEGCNLLIFTDLTLLIFVNTISRQICKTLCVKSPRNANLWLFFFFPTLIESLIWSRSLMYCHICSLYCCVKRASAVWAYKWNQRRVKAKHSPRSIFQYLTSGNSNKYNARDTSMATSRQQAWETHTHTHMHVQTISGFQIVIRQAP